ncbi:MAG: hypothetical protein IJ774_12425 [Selenomonadaceae bacterium]|nr:hypothetical protein [Selenomonadaceae bacterium]
MDRPTITIGGKTYELPRPKGGIWRRLLEFDKNHGNIFSVDAIEQRCEFLAEMYGGDLTADKLLDELYLDEIVSIYNKTTRYLVAVGTSRNEEIEKNASEGDATT